MDTSKEYIKMCDCPEIQEQEPNGKDAVNSFFHRKEMIYIESKTIWLPRQDQIQEMFGWHIIKLFSFFFDFAHESMVEQIGIGNEPKENPLFKSMEQLWFAFYMLEKHTKIWTGEEWRPQ